MPTPGEQKALLFLGAVALLGGAVRLLGDDPPVPPPTAEERAGLASQLAATDSAAAARKAAGGKGSRARTSRSSRQSGDTTSAGRLRQAGSTPERQRPIDVDRATIEELTALPGVGPSLASRIVADRNARGPFGSLEALDVVPGVGPALIRRLGPHVTFSGPRRPSTASGSGGGVRASGRVVGLIGGRP